MQQCACAWRRRVLRSVFVLLYHPLSTRVVCVPLREGFRLCVLRVAHARGVLVALRIACYVLCHAYAWRVAYVPSHVVFTCVCRSAFCACRHTVVLLRGCC